MTGARLIHRVLVAGLSTAVSIGLAWWLWPAASDGGNIELVDDREEYSQLIEKRRGGDGGEAAPRSSDGALRRELVPESDAYTLFPALKEGKQKTVYDPLPYYRYNANISWNLKYGDAPGENFRAVTNSLGMREDSEPASERPDLRVLVTGDSHTDGVCPNSLSFANRLEERLSESRSGKLVEVLNAGTGGYTYYNYLGVLERHLSLDPDVFVVTVYGGNDFIELLRLWHYFERTQRPLPGEEYWDRFDQFYKRRGTFSVQHRGQAISQLTYFAEFPEEGESAVRVACAITAEMDRICRAEGVKLVCVYLPSAWDTQLERYAEYPDRIRRLLGLGGEEPVTADPLADRWLARLEELGVASLDLRPLFLAHDGDLYWEFDAHINLDAHELIAEALQPIIEAVVVQ